MSSVGPPLPLFCRSGFLRETLSPVRPHISGGWPAAGRRGGRARAPTRLPELAPWSPPSARRLPMKEVGWGAGRFWWPCSRGGRLPTAPPEGPRPCAPLAPRAGPPSCSVCVSRWAAGPTRVGRARGPSPEGRALGCSAQWPGRGSQGTGRARPSGAVAGGRLGGASRLPVAARGPSAHVSSAPGASAWLSAAVSGDVCDSRRQRHAGKGGREAGGGSSPAPGRPPAAPPRPPPRPWHPRGRGAGPGPGPGRHHGSRHGHPSGPP